MFIKSGKKPCRYAASYRVSAASLSRRTFGKLNQAQKTEKLAVTCPEAGRGWIAADCPAGASPLPKINFSSMEMFNRKPVVTFEHLEYQLDLEVVGQDLSRRVMLISRLLAK